MALLNVKRLDESAQLPKYATREAAGFDLSSIEEVTLYPSQRAVVRTGLAFDIPFGFEVQLRPRSGLAAKQGVTVLNGPGTIDSDYIEEIKVILINLGDSVHVVNKGDRICQGVIKPLFRAEIREIEDFDEDARSRDRGGGFGSTGK